MPFYEEQTILHILLHKLKQHFPHYQTILATTVNPIDDRIAQTGKECEADVYRGDEENVLNRFIEAGEKYSVSTVIRICADNPFLSVEYLKALILFFETGHVDYVSYMSSQQLPAMKTHYGFFAEVMQLSALKKTAGLTHDKLYLEHVTNYIYANPEVFKVDFLPMPWFIEEANVRLTVDTKEDFKICQEIYSSLMKAGKDAEPKAIIDFVKANPDILTVMNEQINSNKK